ncbi:NusG domain II-containing protein [Clostridium sp. WILCCON 0269]|uniref:NusG domain II-containing protein n=1 Tax=Candidatus Clostridium eludens TaxID=3381663 RepID=A0ABW8SPE2_9CLOT
MKKGDKIVVIFISIVIVISTVGAFIYKEYEKGLNKIAVIKENGKITKTIDLNKVKSTYTFTVKYDKLHFNKIEVQKGRIRISDSDSPRKIGMKMGWISEPGQNVICVPYKLIVEIEGKDPRLKVRRKV